MEIACLTMAAMQLRAFEIRVYRADRPDQPDVFRHGDRADAEPALPGWTMLVDDLLAARR